MRKTMIKTTTSVALIAFGVIALFTVNSCCKKKKILEINYPFVEVGKAPAISLPPLLGGTYFPAVFVQNVASDFNKRINDQGIDSTQVLSVTCKDMLMDIMAPAGTTFKFIDSITCNMAFKDSSSAVLLGTKGNIPDTATRIQMVVRDTDLRSYILKDSFKLIVGGVIDNAGANLPAGVDLRFSVSFLGLYQEK